MAGRRPQPTHLKVVRGNPGRRPLNAKEPKPKAGPPKRPASLSTKARKVWDGLSKMLNKLGVLTEADGYALERLAECYAEILECQEAIQKHGRTYETESTVGSLIVKSRPEVAMLSDADRRFKSYLIEFGLTPAARSKVQVDGETQEDRAEAYFGGKAFS